MGGSRASGLDSRPEESELRDLIARWAGADRVPRRLRVVSDTSDFFRVDYDDVVILAGRPYFIRNYEREGRFGIDEEPKFWVRRAVDLSDGSSKIIKMVFHEKFEARAGGLTFQCARSARKEADVLDMVRGHPNFMQGFWTTDAAGNIIRVIDRIRGKTLADHVLGLGRDHEDYFHNHFPSVLEDFFGLAEAIKFLHDRGQKHGDIRRDHIIREGRTGLCKWIDFDISYLHRENMFGYDLFGLGNVLAYLAGRGDVTVQELRRSGSAAFRLLNEGDLNIIFHNRVVNLRKVYPYVPDALNMVLLHFSTGADLFYETVSELLADLGEAASGMPGTKIGKEETK